MPVPVTGLLFVNAHLSALSGVSSPAVGGPVSCNQTCSTFWPLERRKQARDNGASGMSLDKINQEIGLARQEELAE